MKDYSPPWGIMEEKWGPGKSEKVVLRLRFGYSFFKEARVGYDLARNDEDLFKSLYSAIIRDF